MSEWTNRIVRWDEVEPESLLAHPENWRRHGAKQRNALRGSLNELGWVAPVVVAIVSGRVIDGHARVEEAMTKGCKVPVAYVDLTEDEERKALLSLDPIAAMAEADKEALDALLREVSTTEEGLAVMFADLADTAPQMDTKEHIPKQTECPACGHRW